MTDLIFGLQKPAGLTSNQCLSRLKKSWLPKFGKVKVGHGGTLDQEAEGVLIIGVEKGTKRLKNYLSGKKEYRAMAYLGKTTSTDGVTGEVTSQTELDQVSIISRDQLEELLPLFRGEIWQVPPQYSALKKGGERYSDKARRGEKFEIPPRRVQVDQLEILSWEPPYLTLQIRCGGGTYVRSLVRDLGQKLGVGGYLHHLIRTRQGTISWEDSWSFEELEKIESLDRLTDGLL